MLCRAVLRVLCANTSTSFGAPFAVEPHALGTEAADTWRTFRLPLEGGKGELSVCCAFKPFVPMEGPSAEAQEVVPLVAPVLAPSHIPHDRRVVVSTQPRSRLCGVLCMRPAPVGEHSHAAHAAGMREGGEGISDLTRLTCFAPAVALTCPVK